MPSPALRWSGEEITWLDFMQGLARRGLKGVRLVTSDPRKGLKAAPGQVLNGITWQRRRVHLMRNILARLPKAEKSIVAAALRTIFAQPDREATG